ncbi:hypothetical protein [Hymenobacter sp. HDW8]|uniref:hypothetical protein n=1 Tax=Hymenobacter sp. HDW8 TaxID=2714932 RepID=UPI00140B7FF6|nr:hypothetical protein [Hymenobacter sp. HDW8]QIL76874.1 hypothetical protein G7064_14155 [Hymenobacter sp. HDW8]
MAAIFKLIQLLIPDRNKVPKKIKSAGLDLSIYIIVAAVLGTVLTGYIAYRASLSEQKFFSLSLLALFTGLLFESFRITNNWKHVIYKFIWSYFFSLLCFLPGKKEVNYIFENHIKMWPYYFIVIFSLITVSIYKDKVIAKLTEGITLLLSLSLIYWVIDYGFINIDHWFIQVLLILSLFLSVFSIINALTYFKLSKTIRLILSTWSTIVMFAFAIDNIIRVFQNEDIETTKYLSQGLYIALQYFLLGVSAVYIMQNMILLSGFLPNKNGNYKVDLRNHKRDHIERYSDQQVSILSSILCIIFTTTVYGLNYKYQILPRHTMIWLLFLIFPLILILIEKVGAQLARVTLR